MRHSFSVTRFFLVLLLLAVLPGVLQAQSERTIADSGLFFSVLGDRDGFFSVASVDGSTDVFRYELAAETISFSLSDQDQQAGIFDNPLFCFYFGTPNGPSVKIQADNSSGHLVLEERGLSSALEYQLSGGWIGFTPSDSTQCFYIDANATAEEAEFGLFGMAPAVPEEELNPDDRVFADRFQIDLDRSVAVYFDAVPSSATAGDELSYALVIENVGDVELDQLAFQEVFPGNGNYFPAALGPGTWTCTGTACPQPGGQGQIRLENLSLPAGASVRYEISRPLDAQAAGGSTLALYAGAVDGPGSDAPFDVDRVEIPVVGAAERFEVVFVAGTPQSVTVGQAFPDFHVRAVDSNGLLVSGYSGSADLTFRRPEALLSSLNPANVAIVGGEALLQGIPVPDAVEAPGDNRFIRASADGMTSGDSEGFSVLPAE